MIRVLVVDDSITMRGLISQALNRDPMIQVVGAASDPYEARRLIKELNPDVITLDVEMPNMSGLEFLEKIMRLRPMPVVMVSALTSHGADATLRALELGAVDCVAKPSLTRAGAFEDLCEKVVIASQAKVRPLGRPPAAHPLLARRANGQVVAIGSSTGGVEALITLLSSFPADCPATVITQHMPASFTKSLAERLNRIVGPKVSEAEDGALLLPGNVYLAPGGATHLEVCGALTRRCLVRPGDPVNGHSPSVDVMFRSVAKAAGADAVGVILTGMGCDGAQGLLEMRLAGARTIGQDEASCVVYGMPRTAHQIGAVEHQLPLGRIAAEVFKPQKSDLKERA